MRKKTILIIVIVILSLLTGIFSLYQIKRTKSGSLVSCNHTYDVNSSMVAYRQDNPIWASDKLGTSDFSMKSSGCLVTSIASAISVTDKAMTPGQLNEMLSSHAVYDKEGNLLWDRLDDIEGFNVKVYTDVKSEYLTDCLSQNHYPIVRIHRNTITAANHYILVIGSCDGDFICMDPLEDELTTLSDYKNRIYAVRCVWVDE